MEFGIVEQETMKKGFIVRPQMIVGHTPSVGLTNVVLVENVLIQDADVMVNLTVRMEVMRD